MDLPEQEQKNYMRWKRELDALENVSNDIHPDASLPGDTQDALLVFSAVLRMRASRMRALTDIIERTSNGLT